MRSCHLIPVVFETGKLFRGSKHIQLCPCPRMLQTKARAPAPTVAQDCLTQPGVTCLLPPLPAACAARIRATGP